MTREDFFVAPSNARAVEMLDDPASWPQGKLILVGPAGSGKSHLAQVWASEAGGRVVRGAELADLDIAQVAVGPVAVDDAEAVAGNAEAETALFHLHNFLAQDWPLLLTAQTPPRDWGLQLPDLASRMQAAPIAQLQGPDDALLSAVLVKLFADRQVAVPANLIPYLISRMPRSIGAARALVGELDARALALGRPITRALAAEVLGTE
ncbi:chromosomal replication initiator DnaA [Tabrizicola sp.]|uniref:chromosomal replication initiator DnaA n=1 Tax=Tabrizicola sp. TaxID=2005166 RepID=UPI003F2BCB09